MRPWITSLVVFGVLGVCSAASAQYMVVAPVAVPAPAVYSSYYWPGAPVAPVYVYRPAIAVYRPTVVYRPAVVPVPAVPAVPAPAVAGVAPPVAYPAPVAYSAAYPVYPAPVLVRAKVYYPGQPVRNAVRAVLP